MFDLERLLPHLNLYAEFFEKSEISFMTSAEIILFTLVVSIVDKCSLVWWMMTNYSLQSKMQKLPVRHDTL